MTGIRIRHAAKGPRQGLESQGGFSEVIVSAPGASPCLGPFPACLILIPVISNFTDEETPPGIHHSWSFCVEIVFDRQLNQIIYDLSLCISTERTNSRKIFLKIKRCFCLLQRSCRIMSVHLFIHVFFRRLIVVKCFHVPVVESIHCRAGEHNARRVLPTSSSVYVHKCSSVEYLPNTQTLVISFLCLKDHRGDLM